MLFTAVISVFISEVLSGTARSEFITLPPCIMYGNSLLRCQITWGLYAAPRAPCSCLQLPTRLPIHHYTWSKNVYRGIKIVLRYSHNYMSPSIFRNTQISIRT